MLFATILKKRKRKRRNRLRSLRVLVPFRIESFRTSLWNPLESFCQDDIRKGHGTWFTTGLWPVTFSGPYDPPSQFNLAPDPARNVSLHTSWNFHTLAVKSPGPWYWVLLTCLGPTGVFLSNWGSVELGNAGYGIWALMTSYRDWSRWQVGWWMD